MAAVKLTDGKVYALRSPPRIRVGQRYWTVTCKHCGKDIYLLESKGPVDFTGNGQISTECFWCHEGDLYEPALFKEVVASEALDWGNPTRVAPSNSPRRPLSKSYPKAKPAFGPNFLERKPQMAALVGRCMALWTTVEVALADLLAEMLDANQKPAVALFLTIQNSRIQSDVLDAVADVVLSENDYKLFEALMKFRKSLEKERNALAHGCYGGAYALNDAIAWVDPKHLARHGRAVALGEDSTLQDNIFVYEPGDLETIALKIEDLARQLDFFRGYLFAAKGEEPAPIWWRLARYDELCQQANVAPFLSAPT